VNDDQIPAEEMKTRMLSGELYRPVGKEIAGDQARAEDLLERYNATSTHGVEAAV
jgi:Maltose acetyltransferase hexapeptide capping motif